MASADEPRQRSASIFIPPLVKSQPSSPQSSLFNLILPPSSTFAVLFLAASPPPPALLLFFHPPLSSLCSLFLLWPSGELFRLIGSIHRQSLERRRFWRIPTLTTVSVFSWFTAPVFNHSVFTFPCKTTRWRSYLDWGTQSAPVKWTVSSQYTMLCWALMKQHHCRPLLSWRNSKSPASSTGVSESCSD